MATRVFTDRSGVEWLVWHVRPGQHTGRPSGAPTLPDELADGWLCMESPAGKKRFYPVPPEWETIPEEKFEILLNAAVSVGPRASQRAGPVDAAESHP